MWYSILVLFLTCFLAATVIPFSSEIVFSTTLVLSGIDTLLLVFVAGLGNTLGGLTGYWLGHFGKWNWLEKYFRLSHQRVERLHHFTSKYGYWLALLCWLPIVGDLLCVALGFFRSKLLPVTLLMFIGKTLRYAVVAWITLQAMN